jgi:ABC-type Fe3+/spermidine/putrescine transport system ATPase subunit
MSDRIVIMRDGAIEQIGTPQELYEQPVNQFTASFLGKSNFIQQDGKTYALRPEKIDLRKGAGHAEARTSGVVRSITYFGSMQRVIVDASDGTEIEVDIDVWRNSEALNEGDTVDLLWKDEAAVELQTG